MVLEPNLPVEALLPARIQRRLSDEEMDHYRAPFANPGEDRRPTLSWPRNIPVDGEPADAVAVINDCGCRPRAMYPSCSSTPNLVSSRGRIRELIRTWPNLTETTVNGIQYVPGDGPDHIGTGVAEFVCK